MPGEPLPPVSVVVPVRNDAGAITDAIGSVLSQDFAGPLEVVVAIAPSTDGTEAAVLEIASADDRIVTVPNPAGSTPGGLNAAIRSSTGEIIVRCDARSVLPRDYVSKAVAKLEQTGAVNVGGIQAAAGTGTIQRAVAAAMSSRFGVGDARFHMSGPPGPVDTVYLGVFRREAIEGVGLFDETLARNQDYELNHRLRQAGGVVYFEPELVVEYRPRSSLAALAGQYFDYGRWKRVVVKKHPESLRWRQVAAPALAVGLAASALAALLGRWRLALAIPGLYAITTIAASGIELIRRRDAAMLLLPIVYPIMHLAWGIGFLMPGHPGNKAA